MTKTKLQNELTSFIHRERELSTTLSALNIQVPIKHSVHSAGGHTDKLICCSVSRDGRYLATRSRDKTLRLWDVSTGNCIRTFEEHCKTIESVSLSEDVKLLITGSHDTTVRFWEPLSGKRKASCHSPQHRRRVFLDYSSG